MGSPGCSASGTLGLRPHSRLLPLPAQAGRGLGERRELRKREQNSCFAAHNGIRLFGDGRRTGGPFGQPKANDQRKLGTLGEFSIRHFLLSNSLICCQIHNLKNIFLEFCR